MIYCQKRLGLKYLRTTNFLSKIIPGQCEMWHLRDLPGHETGVKTTAHNYPTQNISAPMHFELKPLLCADNSNIEQRHDQLCTKHVALRESEHHWNILCMVHLVLCEDFPSHYTPFTPSSTMQSLRNKWLVTWLGQLVIFLITDSLQVSCT